MGKTFNIPEDFHQPAVIDMGTPFPCFRLPKDAEPVTLEQTLQAEDEL
jgi:hypothetical protein